MVGESGPSTCNLRAFADEKLNIDKKFKICVGSVEHIAEKGKNDRYHHLVIFFSKDSFFKVIFYKLNFVLKGYTLT